MLAGTSGDHLVQSQLKQGHTEHVAQDGAWLAFEYVQGWRRHRLSRQSGPVFDSPKRVFVSLTGISCISLCVFLSLPGLEEKVVVMERRVMGLSQALG